MTVYSLWSYIWDFVYDGVDRVLDDAAEVAGVNAVSVATSYHSVEHLRPHGAGPVTYRSEAALYFPPEARRYRESGIEPAVSSLAAGRDPLREIAEGCARRGLALRSWTVCLHNSVLARRYPECACRDAFGEPRATALCPANPRVRAYMRALVADLTERYPIATVELESLCYEGGAHTHRHAKVGLELGPLERLLLGLCFCPSCAAAGERRGIDVAAARDRAGRRLRESFAAGRPSGTSVAAYLEADADARAYCAMREEVVSGLVGEVAGASRAPLCYLNMGDRALSAVDPAAVAARSESYLILAYTPSREGVERAVREAAAQIGGAERVMVGLCAYPPASPDAETLAANARAAASLGVRAFAFYNYGIMPAPNLAWVAAATRASTG